MEGGTQQPFSRVGSIASWGLVDLTDLISPAPLKPLRWRLQGSDEGLIVLKGESNKTDVQALDACVNASDTPPNKALNLHVTPTADIRKICAQIKSTYPGFDPKTSVDLGSGTGKLTFVA